MNKFSEARAELRAYFTSALGVAAQSYDPRGIGSDSDPSGAIWCRVADVRALREARANLATHRTLYACPSDVRAVLRAWATPRRSRFPLVRAVLDELAFVAILLGLGSDDELGLEGKLELARKRVTAEKALDVALGAYDALRLERIEAEKRAKTEVVARVDEIIAKIPQRGLFTAEEIEQIRGRRWDGDE